MSADPTMAAVRAWRTDAIRRIEADYNRSADTHLIRLDLPRYPGITLYLKDESSHPTGSLKHRLARSLFLYALCNGWIGPDTCIIEASSGSTAVSEAYFARMLGLRFIAVVPATTAAPKLDAIRFHGGEIHAVDDPAPSMTSRIAWRPRRAAIISTSSPMPSGRPIGAATTISPRVSSPRWRTRSIPFPPGSSAARGRGTSATIGRYIGYQRHATRLCVADPVHSVFHRHFGDRTVTSLPDGCASRIEGIGRPRVEPSFIPSVIDRMIAVEDAASIGAMRALSTRLGRRVGGSTGTNLIACAQLIEEMAAAGERGRSSPCYAMGANAMAAPIMTTTGWPSATSTGRRASRVSNACCR
ncbi:pyridoxal-phosphate dependent enzyme [Sphingomonas sp. I4]